MDNIKHERDISPMQGAYHSKLYKTINTIQYKTVQHQTQLFTKFYDMDSHALMTMYMAFLCRTLSHSNVSFK